MEAETQAQPIPEPQNAPQADSTPIKKQHGGKRPGAGRKPNYTKQLVKLKGFSREAIAEVAEQLELKPALDWLLKHKYWKARLDALVFIRDTLYGRPAQNVQLSGGVMHAHAIWRPLESLTDEEMALLDKLTKKLSAPALNALPDGHQNQTESKPAIEAEVVESGAIKA